MNFLRKVVGRGRLRRMRSQLAQNPSPRTYAALAQEYVRVGQPAEVQRVCEEGLGAFPGNVYLSRLHARAVGMQREQRISELKQEIAEAPRPALWREMCQTLLEAGMLGRAEETAEDWLARRSDPEALFYLSIIRLERFYQDRGRDAGRQALVCLDQAIRTMPEDERPLHAKMEFLMRIGAWRDARTVVGRLLQLQPGAPFLEGRYRMLAAKIDDAPSVERALVHVERTGRLVEQPHAKGDGRSKAGSVQPFLRELVSQDDVHAALYVRGSTVLVQGPKGATAERTARAVHQILKGSRSTARKLGLGQIVEIMLEGDYGVLSIAPGEQDAGAVWSAGPLGPAREQALLGLAGLDADTEEAE